MSGKVTSSKNCFQSASLSPSPFPTAAEKSVFTAQFRSSGLKSTARLLSWNSMVGHIDCSDDRASGGREDADELKENPPPCSSPTPPAGVVVVASEKVSHTVHSMPMAVRLRLTLSVCPPKAPAHVTSFGTWSRGTLSRKSSTTSWRHLKARDRHAPPQTTGLVSAPLSPSSSPRSANLCSPPPPPLSLPACSPSLAPNGAERGVRGEGGTAASVAPLATECRRSRITGQAESSACPQDWLVDWYGERSDRRRRRVEIRRWSGRMDRLDFHSVVGHG